MGKEGFGFRHLSFHSLLTPLYIGSMKVKVIIFWAKKQNITLEDIGIINTCMQQPYMITCAMAVVSETTSSFWPDGGKKREKEKLFEFSW